MINLNRSAWPIRLVRWGSLISLLAVIGQTILAVGQIECSLSSGEACSNQTLVTLNQIKGQPLLFNNLEQKINQLEFTHPVQAQVVSKRLPQTLTLKLTQEPGLYQVNQSDYLITQSGFVFQSSTQMAVPVDLPQTIFDQRILDMSVHQSLVKLINSLDRHQIQPEAIGWQSSEEIILKLTNGLEAIVNSDGVETSGEKLDLILNSEVLDNLNFNQTQLDLRFKLPVLRKTS
ncbi:MAG: hypothetical protein ABIJ03_02165 [Patescibacteria group bacterium]|nr:hypothetical protein [Patescibacteria group bacterium]